MEYLYASDITKYIPPVAREKRSLLRDFYAACEMVKDLPAQDGDELRVNFNTLWSKIKTKDWATSAFLQRHASKQLQDSPLFEVLFLSFHPVKPPTTFAQAGRGGWPPGTKRVEVEFTALEFITTCFQLELRYQASKYIALNFTTKHFRDMVLSLHQKHVNVLDFLSTDLTDGLLEKCRFLKGLVQYLRPVRHHVVLDLEFVESYLKALNRPQGYYHAGSQMLIPPYPPNKWGLCFDYADFLKGSKRRKLTWMDLHGQIGTKSRASTSCIGGCIS
jgi:hypothetical protein